MGVCAGGTPKWKLPETGAAVKLELLAAEFWCKLELLVANTVVELELLEAGNVLELAVMGTV